MSDPFILDVLYDFHVELAGGVPGFYVSGIAVNDSHILATESGHVLGAEWVSPIVRMPPFPIPLPSIP